MKNNIILIPWGWLYEYVRDKYPERMLVSPSAATGFVLTLDEYIEFKKDNCKVYPIPEKYTTFEQVRDAYENGELDYEE